MFRTLAQQFGVIDLDANIIVTNDGNEFQQFLIHLSAVKIEMELTLLL